MTNAAEKVETGKSNLLTHPIIYHLQVYKPLIYASIRAALSSDTDGHRQGLCEYAVNIANTLCRHGDLLSDRLSIILGYLSIFPTFWGSMPAREQLIVKLLYDMGAS